MQAPVGTHQALALLAVLHPRVPAAVGQQAVLVQALAAQTRVALGAAEQIGVGVVAVAHHPAAHDLASLSDSQTEMSVSGMEQDQPAFTRLHRR